MRPLRARWPGLWGLAAKVRRAGVLVALFPTAQLQRVFAAGEPARRAEALGAARVRAGAAAAVVTWVGEAEPGRAVAVVLAESAAALFRARQAMAAMRRLTAAAAEAVLAGRAVISTL